ncbi:hypothetical protein AB4254_10925 [Vibrio breoganii]
MHSRVIDALLKRCSIKPEDLDVLMCRGNFAVYDEHILIYDISESDITQLNLHQQCARCGNFGHLSKMMRLFDNHYRIEPECAHCQNLLKHQLKGMDTLTVRQILSTTHCDTYQPCDSVNLKWLADWLNG